MNNVKIKVTERTLTVFDRFSQNLSLKSALYSSYSSDILTVCLFFFFSKRSWKTNPIKKQFGKDEFVRKSHQSSKTVWYKTICYKNRKTLTLTQMTQVT